jgi:hypothetical protein
MRPSEKFTPDIFVSQMVVLFDVVEVQNLAIGQATYPRASSREDLDQDLL